jgi:3-hydroxyisobutyrate dehydrogenase
LLADGVAGGGSYVEAPVSGSRAPAEAGQLVAMLAAQDFTVQASITNVLENTRLITDEARRSGTASPLADVSHTLYTEAAALGHGEFDMAAIIRAIEARTGSGDCRSRPRE